MAAPQNFVDLWFPALANRPYRVWVRLRATKDQKPNDSAWVQFSDAAVNGAAAYRIGTASGVAVNLEACKGCNVKGWGWQSGAWWSGDSSRDFPLRGDAQGAFQPREDGVQFDQIVLSPAGYFAAPPGPPKEERARSSGSRRSRSLRRAERGVRH